MKIWDIRLFPVSSFHQFPSSDTLFGAICWGIVRIYGPQKLIDSIEKRKFVVSSSFPYIDGACAFYPKPILGESVDLGNLDGKNVEQKRTLINNISKYKKFKKAIYVSEKIFLDILDGVGENTLFQNYLDGKIKIFNNMMIKSEECGDIFDISFETVYVSTLVQKNSIDRIVLSTGKSGQTFYQTEYFGSRIFSLHFLVRTDDIDFFRPVFRYLEDTGIGANRSTGKGFFRIKIMGESNLRNVSDSDIFVSLSRYIPQQDEVEPIFYEVMPYRSKVESNGEFKGEDIFKSKVIYLKEGSIFRVKQKKDVYGTVPVVKEIAGNRIYQNGLAFDVFGKFEMM
ncbi:MAG: type III-A CRISPR-associated RAMP protein Csm4 [Candidatus Calescibacterium sp.]|nr:type III-A CRISPR-associated RAMP protein Csm4 [Candidatus Calescibacterium sp.]MCX7733148.1 type III-A CRISPR-associated RAMP protein Csm4 [bacterium]MDW8087702.1 type III-A CRISPR-associated RAMP protein Csm4 [Candidatus Calescibacterium sp.]